MTHNLSYIQGLQSDYRQVRERLIGRCVPCDRVPHDDVQVQEVSVESQEAQGEPSPIGVEWSNPNHSSMTESTFAECLEMAELLGTKVRRYHVMRVGCVYYGCTKDDILSKTRDKLHVHRRYILACSMRELCGSSLPEIGRTLGGLDHTTVLHHMRRFNRLNDDPVANEERIKDIKTDMDAIRRQSLVYAYTEGTKGWGGSFSLE